MATIVAGTFPTMEQAETAKAALLEAGASLDQVSLFAVNAPGQHALAPIGGDEDADHVAGDAHSGAAKGAALGATAALGVGAAAMAATGVGPVVAAAAVAAGAYTGSLVGTLNKLGESAEQKKDDVPERHAGIMVATVVDQPHSLERLASLLHTSGGQQIEKAEGRLERGEWIDFNPARPPSLIDSRAATSGGSRRS
jgi:hypothetical protein